MYVDFNGQEPKPTKNKKTWELRGASTEFGTAVFVYGDEDFLFEIHKKISGGGTFVVTGLNAPVALQGDNGVTDARWTSGPATRVLTLTECNAWLESLTGDIRDKVLLRMENDRVLDEQAFAFKVTNGIRTVDLRKKGAREGAEAAATQTVEEAISNM